MKDIDDTQAPLLHHLIELRRRLLWSLVALFVAFGGCLYFARSILAFLVRPLGAAGQTTVINNDVYGGFMVELKVAFFAALMIAFPVIANQLWQFIAPGLYRKEKKALLPFLLATPVLFILGACMAYYVAIPERNPLAKRKHITPEAIAGEPFVAVSLEMEVGFGGGNISAISPPGKSLRII